MRSDNRGFSLVEIVVVISILLLLSTAGVIGISAISSKPAEKCAESIKTALLSNRTTALGKYKAMITLENDGKSILANETLYKQGGTVESTRTTKVGSKDVVLTWSIDNGANWISSSDSDLKIVFNRSIGAMELPDYPDSSGDLQIKCTKAGKSYVVLVYRLTGKVVIQ